MDAEPLKGSPMFSKRLALGTLWSPLLLTASCGAPSRGPDFYDAFFENEPPPLYEGLGASGHSLVSSAPDAQAWFDQGLALCWGFNHPEAVRAFQQILRGDPDCALAYWGIAYALGPNINRPKIAADQAERAYRASREALERIDGATDVERALIEALAARYAVPQPADRGDLNVAYADAMRDVYGRFPGNPIVGTLCADAVMNIDRDWRNWGTDEERGPLAIEAIAILERVLDLAPEHVGAHHFYIHSVEASDRPERGLASARMLETLMPAAGHLLHMPGHIYVRLGMYDDTVRANTRAIAADDLYFGRAPESRTPYHSLRAHNHHFLVWAAMFRGSREDATRCAREMVRKMPPGEARLDAYHFVPMHALMRFGLWEQMLEEPRPDELYPVANALWHHGRAIALANLHRFSEAREEAAVFERAAERIPEDARVRKAPRGDLVAIARDMMWGELLFREGKAEEGLASLRRAAETEDRLSYSEPPAWMQPVRHALGALLMEAGRIDEAEEVYREDLARYRNNVWSLHGLAECLRTQGKEEEARVVEARLEEASAHADVEIRASCYCRAAG